MGWILLLAAVAPVAFLMHFIYIRDKYERDPFFSVFMVYIAGFITVIPAAIAESLFTWVDKLGLLGLAISAWGVIALSEETVKYLALRYLAVPLRGFNEVYDGILYGVAVSLGFATVENALYIAVSGEHGMLVAVLRGLLAVPGHALWGVMMGYYVGRAKFEPDRRRQLALIRRGWLMAVFWHGLYDFFAFGAEHLKGDMAGYFGLGVLGVIAINWMIGSVLISRAQAESVFKRPSPMTNPVFAYLKTVKYCHQCGQAAPRNQRYCQRCGGEFPYS